jgi:hypothetical protein
VELYLQFGYGMMDHSRSLVESWGEGTVILSPRDLSGAQLERLAASITGLPGGAVLLDPQFYLPHADHARLVSHDYWPKSYNTDGFWGGDQQRQLLRTLADLNAKLGSRDFILPGLFASHVDADWLAHQKSVIDESQQTGCSLPTLMTVAVAGDVVRSDDQVHEILAAAENWDTSGFYLVCEHPKGDYLVDDAAWVANVLDLVAGLRLRGKRVILGYCNHQLLALATSSATAIASGTWMNVRSFPPEKFRAVYEDEIKQRSIWCYCPQALSEYKLPSLDIARRLGLLNRMRPPRDFSCDHAEILFSGPQPSTVGFTEQAAFRHYLHCLRAQVRGARRPSFDETAAAHEAALDEADSLLSSLHEVGIRGQLRDFRNCLDANRGALAVLRATRGPMLRRQWDVL